ncbi:FERM domain containing isoform X2 [Haematobia irritans]
MDPMLFSFRVKFYPADPFRLSSNGRLMLYQQLKRDLRHGRIYCSIGEAAALGSLIVQEELGDYNPKIHTENYVSSLNLALRQTDLLEKKIIELHKKREPHQDTRDSMDEFMRIVCGLETYGIDPHPVKDHRGTQLYIGINYAGISTFICGKRSQHFRWSEVHKLNFEGKMFIAHLSYTDASREPKKHTIGFKCSSHSTCRYLWRCALEQMLFFTLANSQSAAVVSGGGFFSWGTKFKYTGRTEREILTESITALREKKLNNSATGKRKASSVPATPSSPSGDFEQIRYSSLPRSTMSEPLTYCNATTADCFNNLDLYQEENNGECENLVMKLDNAEGCPEDCTARVSCNLNGSNYLIQSSRNKNFYSNNKAFYDSPSSTKFKKFHTESASEIYNICSQSHNHKHYPRTNTSGSSKTKNYDTCGHNTMPKSAKASRKFKFIHAFIPSVFFVVVLMSAFAIFVIESESKVFNTIRELPEMVILRYQYYLPLKEFICNKIAFFI